MSKERKSYFNWSASFRPSYEGRDPPHIVLIESDPNLTKKLTTAFQKYEVKYILHNSIQKAVSYFQNLDATKSKALIMLIISDTANNLTLDSLKELLEKYSKYLYYIVGFFSKWDKDMDNNMNDVLPEHLKYFYNLGKQITAYHIFMILRFYSCIPEILEYFSKYMKKFDKWESSKLKPINYQKFLEKMEWEEDFHNS